MEYLFHHINHSSTIFAESLITIADAWAVNKYHPELNDEKGLSHLIINSNRGEALLKSIFDGNHYREVAYNEIEPLGVHAPITRSTQPSRYRDFFYSHLDMIDLENLIKKCIVLVHIVIRSRENTLRKIILPMQILIFILELIAHPLALSTGPRLRRRSLSHARNIEGPLIITITASIISGRLYQCAVTPFAKLARAVPINPMAMPMAANIPANLAMSNGIFLG